MSRTAATNGYEWGIGGGTNYPVYARIQRAGTTQLYGASDARQQWLIYTFWQASASNRLYRDGVVEARSASAAASDPKGPLYLGVKSGGSGWASWRGQIAEALLYECPLADNEINDVGFYLQTKYRIPSAFTGTVSRISGSAVIIR
jgi:hypothetical protein